MEASTSPEPDAVAWVDDVPILRKDLLRELWFRDYKREIGLRPSSREMDEAARERAMLEELITRQSRCRPQA